MKTQFSLAIIIALFQFSSVMAQDSIKEPKISRNLLNYFNTSPKTNVIPPNPKLLATIGNIPDIDETKSIQQIRVEMNKAFSNTPKLNEPVAKVENKLITVSNPAGKIGIRIYTPKPSNKPLPVLLYLHGGGWALGNLDTSDDLCRSLAHRSGVIVVSVDYRLAPEYKFPVAVEDSYVALKWVYEHATEINGDRTRLAIAGDSAGGNLTAATALYARDKGSPKVSYQIMLYPVTNYNFETASYFEFGASGFGITTKQMRYFWNIYLKSSDDATNPYASPLLAKNLKGLAPALIITAQYDVLRDEAEAYAARLYQANVPVHLTRYLDALHGFTYWAAISKSGNQSIQEVADVLQNTFKINNNAVPQKTQ